MATKIINQFGEMIGWNNTTLVVWGRELEAINEISYSDNQTVEPEYGHGNMPIGFKKGNYEAKFSFSVSEEERRAMLRSTPPGKRLQDNPPTDVPCMFDHDGNIYKDVIRNVKILNNGVEVKQGDGSIWFKFECFTSHIEWNV